MLPRLFSLISGHHELITDLKQVDQRWLTWALARNGYLERGKATISSCEVWKRTKLSILARLKVKYSVDAVTSASENLLLKFTKPSSASKRTSILGQREFEFYHKIARKMDEPPVPKCYDAAYSPELRRSHFLLEDLSETHFQANHPLPPSQIHCEQNIECLAKFHAYWWNNARFGKEIGSIYTDDDIQQRSLNANKLIADFLKFLDDRVSPHRYKIYQDFCVFFPKLLQLQRDGNLTLVHGDAHSWNFLNPREPSVATCRMIDWEFWGIDTNTNDLAFMMALSWYPERRKRLEEALLRKYYETLSACGVKDYELDMCWNNYRLSVIKHLITPVYQWANGLSAGTWWHNMERSMLAFDDLACDELMK